MNEEITTQPSENANVEVEETTTEVETNKEETDDNPPVRNEKEDARIFYQQRQLDKKNKEITEESTKTKEDLSEDYTQKIDKILSMQQKQQDEAEKKEVQALYPNLAKHFEKADKWWQHESRRNLPYKSVLMEIASDDLLKIGAEMAEQANASSRSGTVHGSTAGKVSTTKSVKDMDKQEFNNYVNSIISG